MTNNNNSSSSDASSAFHYIVTAQPPTIVTHAITAHFTSAQSTNLIVAKSTRLELHELTAEGLEPLTDVPIYGKISALRAIPSGVSGKDLLFVLTERNQCAVLEFDETRQEIRTRHSGSLRDKIGRASETGSQAVIDPDKRCIAMHLYEGSIKVLPFRGPGVLDDGFNVKLDELNLISMTFLHGRAEPTLLVLYQDVKERRHLKTYTIHMADKTGSSGVWAAPSVEADSTLVQALPMPLGGAFCVGQHSVRYFRPDDDDTDTTSNQFISADMDPCQIGAICALDDDAGERWILGDAAGNLQALAFDVNHESSAGGVAAMHLSPLGQSSSASALCYLDNSVVFVGSCLGDSHLVRLSEDKDPDTQSYVEELEAYQNLGPICDMAVVDLDRQGQSQLVTCSGAYSHGSLRVIRNGIGINEVATVEMPGIKGLWSLRESSSSEFDRFLVQSFVGETRVLAVTDDNGMEEQDMAPGLDQHAQTLFCANHAHDQISQVTDTAVRLLLSCGATFESVAQWTPPKDTRIVAAHGNHTQIIVSLSGGALVLLSVDNKTLTQAAHTQFTEEISCLDITPIGQDQTKASLCVVGLWDVSVRVLRVPSLEVVSQEQIQGETIARSVRLARFSATDPTAHLFCGIGDGGLLSFTVDCESGALSHRKKVSLGTQPVVLSAFESGQQTNIFAASDRPTVIYKKNDKLLFSNVNLSDVNFMSSFNTEAFPDCLALGLDSELSIGQIDDIQKLHVEKIALGEQPRRISHDPVSNTYCVGTVRYNSPAAADHREDGGDVMMQDDSVSEEEAARGRLETNRVRLFDGTTFEELKGAVDLGAFETITSSALTCFDASTDDTSYHVVGTAFALPTEAEPSRGRILVFKVGGDSASRALELVSELEVSGAPYSLCPFQGRLCAGVNSKIELLEWRPDEAKLHSVCSHTGHVLALYLKARGDFLICGDLMKSISLLAYKPVTNTIEDLARDYNSAWMCAVEMRDDSVYLGAEATNNLFVVQKNSNAVSDEERARLEVPGRFHLGDFVNVMRHGSLVMSMQPTTAEPSAVSSLSSSSSKMEIDSAPALPSSVPSSSLVLAGVSGMVSCVFGLSEHQFKFLDQVQQAMQKVVHGVGDFKHADWRRFQTPQREVDATNFIDGDLVEQFLDLDSEKQQKVAKHAALELDQIHDCVDAFFRMH